MTAIVGISTACDASSAAVVLENDENDENKGGTPSRRPSSNSRFGSTRGPQTAHLCRKRPFEPRSRLPEWTACRRYRHDLTWSPNNSFPIG